MVRRCKTNSENEGVAYPTPLKDLHPWLLKIVVGSKERQKVRRGQREETESLEESVFRIAWIPTKTTVGALQPAATALFYS